MSDRRDPEKVRMLLRLRLRAAGADLVALFASSLARVQGFGWEMFFRSPSGVTSPRNASTIFSSMLLIFFATRLDIINPADMGDLTHSNLGLLVDRHANPVLHSLLGSVDVISIWVFVLLVIGLAAAANVSRKKAAILLGSLWGVLILGKVAWAAVFS